MDTDVQTYVTSHSHEQGYAGRIEVVTGPTGRRRWPEHVKAAMVLETFRDGVSVSDVARKHGVSAPQLHAWRRAAREGLLPMPEDEALGLVPIVVADGGQSAGGRSDACLALEIGDVRILVPAVFDAAHLGRVIAAVRSAA
ncbi:Transposase, IS3/IS911family [Cereibacter sphaeroides]|jgi:Transposase and inactivated derivatives|uniref:Transposase, IS3/IS911family n=3 Tax=Cereibacter sphaeroides TaxID=1063 RepID=Q3IV04_CERS4|nr:transposase [Cereibacter sphaeroides]ABA81630.1 Transposase, IS3/IS911family [Cereibacter sphaeroides 2.4.1]AMJ49772.1 transposase [Cereibacter sphaeroides]ANS36531.1 transposase [Cereibacter sphaeroides]ATN65543.1 transposase [Cereibacter sphaeroides]GEM95318.1 transposase [Cereibacter sphaeroides]